MVMRDHDLARELEELVTALDRRVPQLERAAESAIAHDAAALKVKALKRLEELRERESVTTPAAVKGKR